MLSLVIITCFAYAIFLPQSEEPAQRTHCVCNMTEPCKATVECSVTPKKTTFCAENYTRLEIVFESAEALGETLFKQVMHGQHIEDKPIKRLLMKSKTSMILKNKAFLSLATKGIKHFELVGFNFTTLTSDMLVGMHSATSLILKNNNIIDLERKGVFWDFRNLTLLSLAQNEIEYLPVDFPDQFPSTLVTLDFLDNYLQYIDTRMLLRFKARFLRISFKKNFLDVQQLMDAVGYMNTQESLKGGNTNMERNITINLDGNCYCCEIYGKVNSTVEQYTLDDSYHPEHCRNVYECESRSKTPSFGSVGVNYRNISCRTNTRCDHGDKKHGADPTTDHGADPTTDHGKKEVATPIIVVIAVVSGILLVGAVGGIACRRKPRQAIVQPTLIQPEPLAPRTTREETPGPVVYYGSLEPSLRQ